jgi:hypothetical protein
VSFKMPHIQFYFFLDQRLLHTGITAFATA